MMQGFHEIMKSCNVCNNSNEDNKIKKKKKLLQVSLFSETDEKLRSLIMRKYGRLEKGLLSFEVEMALRHWLALHTKTQNSELHFLERPNPAPKVMLVFAQVKDYLLRKYYYELPSGAQVNIKHLEEAIANTRGSDPRTIKKWLKDFHKMKLIKPITTALWEIL